jgi:hypothetical protein
MQSCVDAINASLREATLTHYAFVPDSAPSHGRYRRLIIVPTNDDVPLYGSLDPKAPRRVGYDGHCIRDGWQTVYGYRMEYCHNSALGVSLSLQGGERYEEQYFASAQEAMHACQYRLDRAFYWAAYQDEDEQETAMQPMRIRAVAEQHPAAWYVLQQAMPQGWVLRMNLFLEPEAIHPDGHIAILRGTRTAYAFRRTDIQVPYKLQLADGADSPSFYDKHYHPMSANDDTAHLWQIWERADVQEILQAFRAFLDTTRDAR